MEHKGKELSVKVDRTLTKTAGKKELTLIAGGTRIYVPVVVLP